MSNIIETPPSVACLVRHSQVTIRVQYSSINSFKFQHVQAWRTILLNDPDPSTTGNTSVAMTHLIKFFWSQGGTWHLQPVVLCMRETKIVTKYLPLKHHHLLVNKIIKDCWKPIQWCSLQYPYAKYYCFRWVGLAHNVQWRKPVDKLWTTAGKMNCCTRIWMLLIVSRRDLEYEYAAAKEDLTKYKNRSSLKL